MKRYILWDHDGVLVDTEPLYYEATLARLHVPLPLQGYLADMARGRTAWERARERGIDELTIRRHRETRDREYQHLLQARDIEIPGVESLLAALARDYAMAIVTTAKRADFELIHRERDIVRHMDFVLTSGDYARAKPAPDPYLAALGRFRARPARRHRRRPRLCRGRQRVRARPGLLRRHRTDRFAQRAAGAARVTVSRHPGAVASS